MFHNVTVVLVFRLSLSEFPLFIYYRLVNLYLNRFINKVLVLNFGLSVLNNSLNTTLVR